MKHPDRMRKVRDKPPFVQCGLGMVAIKLNTTLKDIPPDYLTRTRSFFMNREIEVARIRLRWSTLLTMLF